MHKVEILVIGGGVVGSAIAYHLAQQKRQVLVVERASVASEPTASWASAGGVRRQGRHPAEAVLASEAIARWHTLEDELAADVHYRRGGNLLVAENDADGEQLAVFVQKQQALGFADVRLLNRDDVRELVPGIGAQIVAGSHSPADGQADPALTTRAFANAAQKLGAVYWTETACHALLVSGARVTGALTARDTVSAETVVLAAGAWSDELARQAGLRLPMQTRALQMVLSTPTSSPVLTPVVSAIGRRLSLKQLRDGSFLLGGGWLGDPTADRRGYTLRQESIAGNWATACAILPAVGAQTVARAWCGLEAMSADEIPFIGPTPALDGLYLAVGFSGHGFALAPAVGRVVADQLVGKPAPELAGLSPSRIERMAFDTAP